MKHTQPRLLDEKFQPWQDLTSHVAGGRLVGRNPDRISGLTNRRSLGGMRTDRPYRKGIQVEPRKREIEKATGYFTREANSPHSRDQGRIGTSLGVHGAGCLESEAGQHGRSSLTYPPQADGQESSYKATPKGKESREEVGQGHSSDEGRDSITRLERRVLTLATLNLKRGIGDCR